MSEKPAGADIQQSEMSLLFDDIMAMEDQTFEQVLAGPPNHAISFVPCATVPNSPIALPSLPWVKLYCAKELDFMNHEGEYQHPIRCGERRRHRPWTQYSRAEFARRAAACG